MKNYTAEELKAMDFDDAKAALLNRVYEAAFLFEQLEMAGKVSGNGHHAAQNVCEFAKKELTSRWIRSPNEPN